MSWQFALGKWWKTSQKTTSFRGTFVEPFPIKVGVIPWLDFQQEGNDEWNHHSEVQRWQRPWGCTRLVCLCNMRNLPSGWRNSHFGISESKNVEAWTMDLTWRLDNGSTVPSKSLDHPNSSKSSCTPPILGQGWRLHKSRSLPHRYLRKNSTHTLPGDSVTKVVLYKLHPTSAEELGSLCIVLPWQNLNHNGTNGDTMGILHNKTMEHLLI